MLQTQPRTSPSTSLRLFTSDEPDDELQPTEQPRRPAERTAHPPPVDPPPGYVPATLRQCFDKYILPELQERGRSQSTINDYKGLLSCWERYTANPPVHEITKQIVKEFRTALVKEPYRRGKTKAKRSPATVNRIMRGLSACLNPLRPADRANPDGLGLIDFFGLPEPIAEPRDLPFVFSRKAMSALYLACDACRPKGGYHRSHLYDPRLWRAAIVLALNAGPRTWDLFALRRDQIRFNYFKHGAVSFTAKKTGKWQGIPLNKAARTHLEYVLSLNLDPVRLFPGFNKNKSFYAAWKRICAKAGVNAVFESFRKTCSTLHDETVEGTGARICGHAEKGVNDRYYQNYLRRVKHAIYSLKLPAEFVRGARAIRTLPEFAALSAARAPQGFAM